MADERLTGPSGASRRSAGSHAARLRRDLGRDEDLDSVDERRREVHGREVGAPHRAAGTMDGVRDASAVAKPVETWAAHFTDDVHHQHRTRRSLDDRLERDGRGLRLVRRARVREPLTEQREHDEREAHAHERGRARDGDRHAPIVAAAWSHVVHDFVTMPAPKRADDGAARSRS